MTDLSIGASWVAENAPPDAIVMVNEPIPAYVQVKRKTVSFPTAGQNLESYLTNRGVEYIIVSPRLQSPRSYELDPFIAQQILPALQSAPEKFVVVFANPENNVEVYRYIGGQQE